jgi:hypothetical protein
VQTIAARHARPCRLTRKAWMQRPIDGAASQFMGTLGACANAVGSGVTTT